MESIQAPQLRLVTCGDNQYIPALETGPKFSGVISEGDLAKTREFIGMHEFLDHSVAVWVDHDQRIAEISANILWKMKPFGKDQFNNGFLKTEDNIAAVTRQTRVRKGLWVLAQNYRAQNYTVSLRMQEVLRPKDLKDVPTQYAAQLKNLQREAELSGWDVYFASTKLTDKSEANDLPAAAEVMTYLSSGTEAAIVTLPEDLTRMGPANVQALVVGSTLHMNVHFRDDKFQDGPIATRQQGTVSDLGKIIAKAREEHPDLEEAVIMGDFNKVENFSTLGKDEDGEVKTMEWQEMSAFTTLLAEELEQDLETVSYNTVAYYYRKGDEHLHPVDQRVAISLT